MRADLGTIQQTLTAEAAGVLNQSISEAARRNHGQTTPLHVAATLLSSPSGFLRKACIKSHPNSSHPLQCRALELCFSVALDRLPTATVPSAASEPPVSNALLAALKRAQAHQRRGSPENQQQPLLAMKVELEQLIISILDDPSVSRVMREASFSSPAVKAAIEQAAGPPVNPSGVGFGFRPGNPPVNRNLYVSPRLQQNGAVQTGIHRTDELGRVREILLRANKRNPILVGESEPKILVKEILGKIENGEFPDQQFRNSQIVRVENELNSEIATRISEISRLIEDRMGKSDLGAVILDLGDLNWLVDNHQGSRGGTAAAEAVAEMRKLLERFGTRLWLIGTATCETYLRCQVYYPSMENDWGLQAVLIAAKTPNAPTWNQGSLLSNTIEPISPMRNFPATTAAPWPRHGVDGQNLSARMSCCPQCTQSYKADVAKLQKSNPGAAGPQLPQWLQNAKSGDGDAKTAGKTSQKNDQELLELQKKWNETCFRVHHSYHQQQNLIAAGRIVPSPVPIPSVCGIVPNPRFKLQTDKISSGTPFLNAKSAGSPPGSPVRTDLVLGRAKKADFAAEKTLDKIGFEDSLDIETFKRLLKGLSKNVWWQHDAASAVAATVSQCRLGNGKRRGVSSKNDVWLLFAGPDRVGKKKMASALSDLISGSTPTTINLGSRRDEGNIDFGFRGKTALDRIVESVKRNPSSVIMLEDIDGADMLLRGSIKRAMERGRICDSHGREINLGNVIFILTANWSTEKENDSLPESFVPVDEDRLLGLVSGGWHLRMAFREKTPKRIPSWLYTEEERSVRSRKESPSGLSFDLNEAADADNDKAIRSSGNCSDLTIDHDQDDNGSVKTWSQIVPGKFRELLSYLDDSVYFRPVDFGLVKRNTEESLKNRLSAASGRLKMEIKDDALERIAGGVWLGRIGIEEWIEKVFVPNLNQMKSRLSSNQDENVSVRLELDEDSDDRDFRDFLPTNIKVMTSLQE